jgi:4-amino-4-deoxy-L-arabinose transferase-like glycosyltransferase
MQKKELVFLLIVLIIATVFRLWQLDKIPPGLYPDEAINGNEAISNPGKIFYTENNGREGLFINLLSLSFSIFGISIWALRIIPAIIGILTVLGIYFLTKELLAKVTSNERKATSIALLSSLFLAVSFWHVNFSRIGFRAILLPFIMIFSFYFLFQGFRKRKISDFVISGIFFGLGFHTYISFRFAVLILPFILTPFWFIYRKENQTKKFLLFTFCFLLSIFIIALPIGIHFLQNPQDFVGRAAPISVFAADSPVKEFGKSLALHLLMFNFTGDNNWRHNFAGSPQLFWPVGIFFIIGIIFAFKECFKFTKDKDWLQVNGYWLLLSWFFIMLLPGVLTYEGIPHALRVIGVIPVVYIFAAIGAFKIYQLLKENSRRKTLLCATITLFLLALLVFQFNKYFVNWGKNHEVKGAFTQRFVKEGEFLNNLPPETRKYVIVNEGGVPVPWPDGIPMPAQTVMFIESTKYNSPQSTYLLSGYLDQIEMPSIPTLNNKETVILAMKYDENLFEDLTKRFPQGKIEEIEEFLIYKINH